MPPFAKWKRRPSKRSTMCPALPASSWKTDSRTSILSSTKCESPSFIATGPLPWGPDGSLQKMIFFLGTCVFSQKRHVSCNQCSIFCCILPPGLTLLTRKVLFGPNAIAIFRTASNPPGASLAMSQATLRSQLGSPSLVNTPPMSMPMRGCRPAVSTASLSSSLTHRCGVVRYPDQSTALAVPCPTSSSSSSSSMCSTTSSISAEMDKPCVGVLVGVGVILKAFSSPGLCRLVTPAA
mmetsp:Transcript_24668/g.56959  ORF Transcript_24668/g.56959 Transcript_24668/m.56959 type:complete len:237 (+) Transcript_24668:1112-1822(+)